MAWLFGIVTSILGSLIARPIRWLFRWFLGRCRLLTRQIEFYNDRSAMIHARGGLENELRTVEIAWAAWYTGTYASAHEVFSATRRIQRLILLDPEGAYVREFSSLFQRTPDELRSDIQTATRQALKAGVQVRWFDGPITNMLLGDPDSPKGWARVEVLVSLTANRPGFVVNASGGRQALFLKLKTAYQAMWEKAREAEPQ